MGTRKRNNTCESPPRYLANTATRAKSHEPRLRFPNFSRANEWDVAYLGDVLDLEYGNSLAEEKRKNGPYPVVGSNGIVGFHDEYIVDGPVIVIGRKGSAGLVNWIDSSCYPIDTTYYVVLKKRNKHLLAFIKLILEKCKLHELKDHGAIPGLSRDEVYRLKIYSPDLTEQQIITSCLSSLDELISVHNRKRKALKKYKRSLMQQLFPAEGETVPRLRFTEFRDAGEWEEVKLSKIVRKIGSGITPLGGESNYTKNGRPFIRSQNIGWGYLSLDDVAHIDENTHLSFNSTEIYENDVLLNITGASIGRSAIADVRILGGNVNQHVCIIRVIEKNYIRIF